MIGLDFLNVHQAASAFATSVIYDRAGTGWSETIALPRSAAHAAGELRALLDSAGVEPPYVLVGHSLGGAYARRFAQLFPDLTGGLVMLDPAHEGYLLEPRPTMAAQARQILSLIRPLLDMKGFYRPKFEAMLSAFPEPYRTTLVDYHLHAWRRSLQEAGNLHTHVLAEITQGGALPDIPMLVLTAMGIDPFMAPFAPEAELLALKARKRGYYDAFAGSTSRGENRLIEEAGHSTLHTDRPDAVIAAIRDVTDAVGADAVPRRRMALA
jgi:pimeloyl-ACP methyl ester carboxylesterase